MNERINPNFDINAKCQSMIEEANKIIKVYLETSNLYEDDGRYNLAYDVKNYLPKLQQENKHYKHIIDELEKWLKEEMNIYDEARKMHEEYSVPEERCNAKYYTTLKALNKLQELKGSEK